jgi:uncharacterized membrane protein (TIGR01218 family)
MVETLHDKYGIEDVKRINIRYYLIEVHGKWYIIDFSNPRDMRNYFQPFFPALNHKWAIYDVTNSKDECHAKDLRWFQGAKGANFVCAVYIFYLVNVTLFPPNINMAKLTYDPRISQHWIFVLLLLIISIVLIAVILCSLKSIIRLDDKPSYTLELVRNHDTKQIASRMPVMVSAIIIVFVFFFLFIGIGGSSYSQLLMFAVFPLYSMVFGKFSGFLVSKNNRYRIIMKEVGE